MSLIVIVWIALFSVFFSVPSTYYFYMKRSARKPWNLKTDNSYNPWVSVLVPVHNEEKVIQLKLENACAVEYGGEKEIIVIDDSSTDQSLVEISKFIETHPEANIRILEEKERVGKIGALNLGLKCAKGDITIVSDADCFWPPEILSKALPYLADPSVGSVIGRQVLLNPRQSWVTRSEEFYRDRAHDPIRLGESKIHSTIISSGGFCAYKRSFLAKFVSKTGADDSETALEINQNGGRTIFVPEVTFFTAFPPTMMGKLKIKIRRAGQLAKLFVMCLTLVLKKKLYTPKKVVLPLIYLHIVNPLVFLALLVATGLLFLEFPVFLIYSAFVLPAMLLSRLRTFLSEVFLNNCLVLGALFICVIHKKFEVWSTVQECRSLLNSQMLERKGLLPMANTHALDEID